MRRGKREREREQEERGVRRIESLTHVQQEVLFASEARLSLLTLASFTMVTFFFFFSPFFCLRQAFELTGAQDTNDQWELLPGNMWRNDPWAREREKGKKKREEWELMLKRFSLPLSLPSGGEQKVRQHREKCTCHQCTSKLQLFTRTCK